MSDRSKRPGDMDDDERALIGREHRESPQAVPLGEFSPGDQDFTPVGNVIERIEEVMTLDERDRLLLRLFWQHTANMEMRARKRSDSQDSSLLAKRIAELESFRVDLTGAKGDNGKFGNLRKSVDGILSKGWWLITVLVGGIGAAGVKLIIVGRAYGELETQVHANSARIELVERATFLKFLPADVPEKDHTP